VGDAAPGRAGAGDSGADSAGSGADRRAVGGRGEAGKKTEDRGPRKEKTEDREMVKKGIKTVKDLDVYNLAYEAAMEIFEISKTDQIRKSSRSVAVNIREGFAKKRYLNVFTRHCTDAAGSSEETRGWLDFSRDCLLYSKEVHQKLDKKYDRINAMLNKIIEKWTIMDENE
jgi:four helix bundle protein